jgi:hypothetical protein
VAPRRTAELIQGLEASVSAEMASADAIARFTIKLSATEALDRLQKMQERESRAIASLATKMRITQQATINKRGNKIKKPWEF